MRPEKSYLIDGPESDESQLNPTLPYFSYWVIRRSKRVLMYQSYHIDSDAKDVEQHMTKLRNKIRQRYGFVMFFGKPVLRRKSAVNAT